MPRSTCLGQHSNTCRSPGEHVAGRGPRPFLDPRRGPAALRAAARGFAGGVGDHVRYRPAVLCHRHRRDQQPGNPQQCRRHRAGRRAASRRGLRGPGAAGSVHGGGSFCGFLFLGRNENRKGTAFLSARLCNSQPHLQVCGQAVLFSGRLRRGAGGNGLPPQSRTSYTAGTGSRGGYRKRRGTVSGDRPPSVTEGSQDAGSSQGAVAASRAQAAPGSCPSRQDPG